MFFLSSASFYKYIFVRKLVVFIISRYHYKTSASADNVRIYVYSRKSGIHLKEFAARNEIVNIMFSVFSDEQTTVAYRLRVSDLGDLLAHARFSVVRIQTCRFFGQLFIPLSLFVLKIFRRISEIYEFVRTELRKRRYLFSV